MITAMYRAGMLVEELSEAGLVEVYEAEKNNMGNLHTDYVGQYKGGDLSAIPEGAFIEYSELYADEYAETILANASGNAEDYVCDETGKVLIVQYFVPTGNLGDVYAVEVTREPKAVKWWSAPSLWDALCNEENFHHEEFRTVAEAEEYYSNEDGGVPDELLRILSNDKMAISVSDGENCSFHDLETFDKEKHARNVLASDLHCLLVFETFEEAYETLNCYSGERKYKVEEAVMEIIYHAC